MGQTDAHARMPNPSEASTALLQPTPVARTNGTVTGPVVTPALSQAMLMKSSFAKLESTRATAYLRRIKTIWGTSKDRERVGIQSAQHAIVHLNQTQETSARHTSDGGSVNLDVLSCDAHQRGPKQDLSRSDAHSSPHTYAHRVHEHVASEGTLAELLDSLPDNIEGRLRARGHESQAKHGAKRNEDALAVRVCIKAELLLFLRDKGGRKQDPDLQEWVPRQSKDWYSGQHSWKLLGDMLSTLRFHARVHACAIRRVYLIKVGEMEESPGLRLK